MTRKTFEAARDCTYKIKGMTPTESQIKEMFSFISVMDRLSEICEWEGPSRIKIEADILPGDTAYEKAFKEGVYRWLDGAGIDEASDHVADKYFEENPAGYDAAIFFAAVFGVGNILKGKHSFGYIDHALQYLLPDGWRWHEEDEKEAEAHEDDEDWYSFGHSHREAFIGDPEEEIRHRFDDIKICNLIADKDPVSKEIGKKIAERLPEYKDGALQLIMKELTYSDLEKALYVLTEEAEDTIMSNIGSCSIPIIKGDCILYKDMVSSSDIRVAVEKFEEAINAYDGDIALEAGYED